MNLDLDNMLTIGTIVKLKLSPRNVMIIGYSADSDDELYDYIGCAYPLGVFDLNHNLVFNVDDIDKVISEGYSSELSNKYKEKHMLFLKEVKSMIETKD